MKNTTPFKQRTATIKTIILVNLMLIAFLILGTRLATFLHEVLGHTLIALITGGSVSQIKISLFGGGRVWANLRTTNVFSLFLFAMSGIMLNLITGLFSILLSKKSMRMDIKWKLFLNVFALASILGALAYLITGIYYEFGDPVGWTKEAPYWYQMLWLPLLITIPFITYWVSRQYVSIQEQIMPSSGSVSRFAYTSLTIGMAMIIYLILFILTSQTLASTTASEAAYLREQSRILETKKQILHEHLKKQYPDLAETEIQEIIQNTRIKIERDEVPEKFPILPLVLGLCFLSGSAAVIRKPKMIKPSNFKIKPREVVLYCLAATIVILVLAFTGELIYYH